MLKIDDILIGANIDEYNRHVSIAEIDVKRVELYITDIELFVSKNPLYMFCPNEIIYRNIGLTTVEGSPFIIITNGFLSSYITYNSNLYSLLYHFIQEEDRKNDK